MSALLVEFGLDLRRDRVGRVRIVHYRQRQRHFIDIGTCIYIHIGIDIEIANHLQSTRHSKRSCASSLRAAGTGCRNRT